MERHDDLEGAVERRRGRYPDGHARARRDLRQQREIDAHREQRKKNEAFTPAFTAAKCLVGGNQLGRRFQSRIRPSFPNVEAVVRGVEFDSSSRAEKRTLRGQGRSQGRRALRLAGG